MNNLGTLIKIHIKTSFGFNKAKFSTDKKAAGRSTGMSVLLIICYILILFAVFAMALGMTYSLQAIGAEYIMLNIMMMAASLVTLFTSIYKVNGTLFGFKDYDMLMSLPIKTSTIISSRILILYGMNILFVLMLMVPAAIAYAIVVSPPAIFYLLYVVTLIAIPMLPIILATIIGSLIAMAASRFKRKNGFNVIFTIIFFMAFMVVWLGFWTNSDSILINFANLGGTINDVLVKVYPMTALYSQALSGNGLSLLLFLLISLGAFAAFVAVIAKSFGKINTALTTNRAAGGYKTTELKQTTPKRALYKREMKRYLSSSQYVLNTAVGLLLLTVVSVVLVVAGVDGLGVYADIPGFARLLSTAGPIALSFFIVISCTTSSSVSLEGKTLWLVRSLPVDTRDVLKAKINVALTLYYPAVIINATLFSIALKPDITGVILMYLLPLAYGYFIALFGLYCNLHNVNLDWTNEVSVIKNSKATLVVMLVGFLITILPAILAVLFGGLVLFIMLALMVILSILIYRSLMTKGVKLFESY